MLISVDSVQFCVRCGAPLTTSVCPNCGMYAEPWQRETLQPSKNRWLIVLAVVAGIIFQILIPGSVVARYLMQRSRRVAALQQRMFPTHQGPVAPLDQLKGSGRIYLVQMGPHTASYSLDEFAAWLKSKYKLEVQVLPPKGLDKSAWDASRNQYVAESLYAQLKREHPELAADPKAYLYGFTDADMYSVNYFWEFTFTQRDHHRAAMISSARMQDTAVERRGENDQAADQHLQQRLRRILLKDVAIQYWQLALNNDPSSLLHQTLEPDLPTEEIYASDLDPEHTWYGRFEGEPCVFLNYSAKDGIAPAPGLLIRSCTDLDDATPDESQERFELDLRLGLLMDRHFDFYLPDTVPIQFERVTRDGWVGPMGFGMSGTNNYDRFLQSNDMVVIQVIKADGGRCHFKRTPNIPLPLSQLRYIDTDYSGKKFELRWYSSPFEHFELKKFNGEVQTYLPCEGKVICYEIGYRNADGQELTFQRDAQRRLTRLTSPGKQWISLSYGPANTITEIQDSRGRTVTYDYDGRKRLVRVTYPSGEVHSYEYDDQQHLLTFSVARDAKGPARVILRNTYDDGGRVAMQTLADGAVYKYTYDVVKGSVRSAVMNTPDGKTYHVKMYEDSSTVWERSGPEKPSKPTLTAHAGTVSGPTEWLRNPTGILAESASRPSIEPAKARMLALQVCYSSPCAAWCPRLFGSPR